MFLVEATGRLVHANAAGHVMLKEADIFRVSSGGLTTGDRHAARTLAGKANCAFCLPWSRSAVFQKVAEALGSPKPLSRRISAAFNKKSAPGVRPTSSRSLQASPIRSAADPIVCCPRLSTARHSGEPAPDNVKC
jgi:hypothetical protein